MASIQSKRGGRKLNVQVSDAIVSESVSLPVREVVAVVSPVIVGASTLSPEAKVLSNVEEFMDTGIKGAILEVCTEKKATSINKESGATEFTSFCLTYLYYCMMRDQISVLAQEHARSCLTGRKAKATAKDLAAANVFNQVVVLSFTEEDMFTLMGYCKSEKQMKFWKMLWFSFMKQIETNLKTAGYVGKLKFPKYFFKEVEAAFNSQPPPTPSVFLCGTE
jgi:hypothetical protein